MKKLVFGILLIVTIIIIGMSVLSIKEPTYTFDTSRQWRLGYIEGGYYALYGRNLSTLLSEMIDQGFLKCDIDFSKHTTVRDLWQAASRPECQNGPMVVVADAFYTSDWSNEKRIETRDQLLVRLNETADIDILLAFGTLAALDVSSNAHQTPTVVMSTSDPVRSKIIDEPDRQKYSHVFVINDPLYYQEVIRLLYSMFPFKRLGVMYDPRTPETRSHSRIDDLRIAATRFGFSIVECHTVDSVENIGESIESINRCVTALIDRKIDAVFITNQNGIWGNNGDHLLNITDQFIQHRIIPFGQDAKMMDYGVVLAVSHQGGSRAAKKALETFYYIMNESRQRDYTQVFQHDVRILVNHRKANDLGIPLRIFSRRGTVEIVR